MRSLHEKTKGNRLKGMTLMSTQAELRKKLSIGSDTIRELPKLEYEKQEMAGIGCGMIKNDIKQ